MLKIYSTKYNDKSGLKTKASVSGDICLYSKAICFRYNVVNLPYKKLTITEQYKRFKIKDL